MVWQYCDGSDVSFTRFYNTFNSRIVFVTLGTNPTSKGGYSQKEEFTLYKRQIFSCKCWLALPLKFLFTCALRTIYCLFENAAPMSCSNFSVDSASFDFHLCHNQLIPTQFTIFPATFLNGHDFLYTA